MAQFENFSEDSVGKNYLVLSSKPVSRDHFSGLAAGVTQVVVLFTSNFEPTAELLGRLLEGRNRHTIQFLGSSENFARQSDADELSSPGIMVEITLRAGDQTAEDFTKFFKRLDELLGDPMLVPSLLTEVLVDSQNAERVMPA